MASPAIDSFNADINASNLNNSAKTLVRNRFLQAVSELEIEFCAHVQAHIDAMLPTANASDSDLLKTLQAVIAGIEADGAPIAAQLSDYLSDRGQGAWTKLIRSLFTSRDLTQANARWDAIVAFSGGTIPAQVETYLTRLRQFIASKGY